MKKRMLSLSPENDKYLRQQALAEKRIYGSLSIVLNRILDEYRARHRHDLAK